MQVYLKKIKPRFRGFSVNKKHIPQETTKAIAVLPAGIECATD
jgi:hypothetical protein